jgi:hypothetical protein
MKPARTALLVILAAAASGCGGQGELSGQAARFADFRGGKDAPTYRAVLVEAAPKVDGEMDPGYEAAEPIRFVFINGARRSPKAPTTARLVCTRDALYVLFRCRYTDPGAVQWSRRVHDEAVWHDNNVEVFLDPTGTGGSRYYQLTVNVGGTTSDSYARQQNAWDPKLQVATKVRPGEWTAEVKIPFDELRLQRGRINKVWRMNLTRFTLAPAEDTSWCVLGDYNSHVPGRFGYLWVDAGEVLNVTDQDMQPWQPIFDGKSLSGWRVQRGRASAQDGMILVAPDETAVVLLKDPLPYDDLAISAEVMSDKQFRFMFSRDSDNRKMGFYATFINLINESNVALMKDWEYWAPPMGFHLTIPHYGPCPMRDETWYCCEVRFRPGRTSLLLDGRVLLETPNLYPDARHFGLHVIGGGKVRKIRIRKLVGTE